MKRTILMIAGGLTCLALSGCLDSNANWRWESKKVAAAVPAPTPPRETEMRPIQIDTQPQGAAIIVDGHNVGYSPVSINVQTFKDDGTLVDGHGIIAMPTAPGEYQQAAIVPGFFSEPDIRVYNRLMFYMYNNRP